MLRTVVSAQALRERLDDPNVIVVDCRHSLADFEDGRRQYEASHIPGAFFANVELDLAGAKTGSNGRHPLPAVDAFAGFLQSLGVNDDTQVVAYDAGADIFAARLWFLCRWIGHDACAVLDGGFATWNALGYPTTASIPASRPRGDISARERPELLVDADFVLRHLRNDRMQLIDARANERFTGSTESIDPVAGHIPGARNRWFKENFEPDGSLKSPERLATEFRRDGIDPERTVHQCGSGVSAAVNQLAMEHAGLNGSRIYNGSWSEWVADPSRPVERG